MKITDFNFSVSASVCSYTGKVLLSAKLYVVVCDVDGVRHAIRYYLNRDDAENTLRVYSEDLGYVNVRIEESLVFL